MTSTDVTQTTPMAEPPEPPRRRATPGRLVTGLLLVLLGVGWLLETLDVAEVRWQTALSVAVVAIGLTLLAFGRRSANEGLVGLGVVLSVLLVLTAALPQVPISFSAGERNLSPSAADLEPSYELGMGTMELDLRATDLAPGRTELSASVGMGELIVLVPDGDAVEVEASAGAGNIEVFDQERNGVGPTLSLTEGSGGDQRLVLELSVGLGTVEVRR